jgi:two-component system phosphate regulon sensor histidine kinase PhoR
LWRTYLVTFSLILIAVLVGGWEGAVLAIALSVVLLFLNIRGILSPLATMATAAQAMAKGSYGQRIIATEFDESSIASLGQALNSISSDLARRIQAITEDRHRLETVLAATLEGVVAIDSDRRVTLMNQASQRLLGVKAADCLGRSFEQSFRHQALRHLASEAVAANQLRSAEMREGTKTLEVYATPLKAGMGLVLVVHDVTEMRRLETLRRDFVANVSHELKTPLTSIRAYVDTLIDGGLQDQENNLRFLRKIETHASRLAALISDLLSLSKIESGDAFSQHMKVNLGELVLGSFQRLGPLAEAKKLGYRVHVSPKPLHILGDMEAIHQIFDNLIDNAIKYTEAGGSIEVSVDRRGDQICVSVKDTGIGIPREDLPRIFERFYRVDKARSREIGGTGLGLSIAKHLVQAIGGEIEVESEVGTGTTFTTRFPVL